MCVCFAMVWNGCCAFLIDTTVSILYGIHLNGSTGFSEQAKCKKQTTTGADGKRDETKRDGGEEW